MTTGDLCHEHTPYLVMDLFQHLCRYLQYFIKRGVLSMNLQVTRGFICGAGKARLLKIKLWGFLTAFYFVNTSLLSNIG